MDWQPIETAPKNGTPVDLWIPETAKGNNGPAHLAVNCQFEYGRWLVNGEFFLPWLQDATHWMPLPDPPEKA